jgi:hypothetical protein
MCESPAIYKREKGIYQGNDKTLTDATCFHWQCVASRMANHGEPWSLSIPPVTVI